ncbi:MAG: site-specific DNA-methyltransferase, partial [Patescibacteria group bacterium]
DKTVWRIPLESCPENHHAVMPQKLAERCILAGSCRGNIILDPFFGSGTVGMVAERLGRRWLGIELNRDYAPIIERRTAQMGLWS